MNLLKYHIGTVLVACCIAFFSVGAAADETTYDRKMQLNTRFFDLGVDPESLNRGVDPTFIPLNRAKWLGDLMEDDPLLDGVVVHIRANRQAAAILWGPTGPANQYLYSGSVSKEFLLDGYEVKSTLPDRSFGLNYRPLEASPSFSSSCWTDTKTETTIEFCGLHASYPPDPNIYLLARIYNPQRYEDLGKSFREIAVRIRNIAYCLDVTEEEHQELPPFEAFEDLDECIVKFTS